uniref:Uncharacterized protein n=1 Tax=Aegilops tauschii TaxID=37682 RepID=R7W226_AEGTA
MEQDGGASRRPVTSGTIVDELPPVISWTDISVSDGPPREDDIIQPLPMPAFFWPHLRRLALHRTTARATVCVDQYVFLFIQGEHGNLDRPLDASNVQSSARSILQTDEGFAVPGGNPPGMNYIGRTGQVAAAFGEHVMAATRRTRDADTVMPARPQRVRASRWDEVACVCTRCADQMWYRPCCGEVSCRLCDVVYHRPGCTRAGRPVLVPPLFRTESGQRPPGAFVQLAHPEWQMFRYISGDRYVLTSFYQTEDAHYFHADRGIRIQAHLYRRDSPTSWAWRLEFVFTIMPTGPVDIVWWVYLAPQYV